MSRDLGDLIAPDAVLHRLVAADKAGVLAELAALAARRTGLAADAILDVIRAREALGSTGFGAGTAIPHGRIDPLGGVVAVMATLASPVDFAALDGQPVDVVVMMLGPVGASAEPLKALARVSRALRDKGFVDKLRGSATAEALHALITGDAQRPARAA